MTTVSQLRLLWWRKMLEMLRTPAWAVMSLTTPLLYLALFAPLLHRLDGGPGFTHGSVLDIFLPGILALMAFSAGMGAGWVVITEVQTGITDRLLATPTRRATLLAGQMLRDITTFLFPAAIVIVAAIPLDYHPSTGGLLILLVLLSLVVATTSAWSAALGLKLRDIGALAAIVTGLQLPLLLLSGILLPLTLAPAWLRAAAHLDPLYYVVQAARGLSHGVVASSAVLTSFLIMTALTVATTTWATRAYSPGA